MMPADPSVHFDSRADTVSGGRTVPSGKETPARLRACLACGIAFESEGNHNRLCQQCRKRS
jgi:hypothetical protein